MLFWTRINTRRRKRRREEKNKKLEIKKGEVIQRICIYMFYFISSISFRSFWFFFFFVFIVLIALVSFHHHHMYSIPFMMCLIASFENYNVRPIDEPWTVWMSIIQYHTTFNMHNIISLVFCVKYIMVFLSLSLDSHMQYNLL